MSYYRSQTFKYKKRLGIKSLQAAICNVALFKNMKEKQFKDEIFISYCEDGVILEAVNQQQWQRASDYVQDFLEDKKIAMFTYGHQRQAYQDLISRGLKDYTRRVKEQGDECPYINIIHHQKLRKSCEYMDKEKYVDPLKYWQSKNKVNPNFAFLIVQPQNKFPEVKRYLLEVLLKKQVRLSISYFNLMEFLYLFCNSANKDQIRQLCDKKIIQASVIYKGYREYDEYSENQNDSRSRSMKQSKHQSEKSRSITSNQLQSFDITQHIQDSDYEVQVVNYSDIILTDHQIKIVRHAKNLSKVGLEYIPHKQVESHFKNIKSFLKAPLDQNGNTVPVQGIYQNIHKNLLKVLKNQKQDLPDNLQNGYSIVPYRKCEREKCQSMLHKLIKSTLTKNKTAEELNNELKKFVVCNYDEIEFICILPLNKGVKDRNLQAYNKESQQSSQKESQKSSLTPTTNPKKDTSRHLYKVSINDCPYMLIQHQFIPAQDLDTFLLYLEQLKTYYCTYLVRFYGISIRYGQNMHKSHLNIFEQNSTPMTFNQQVKKQHSFKQISKSKMEEYSYYLIFDYHHRNIATMIQNDLIIDNFQIGNIMLQLLYLCQFLHTHDEPRCLGKLDFVELFWPLAVVLPYLGISSTQYHQIQDQVNDQSQEVSQCKVKDAVVASEFEMNCSQEGFEGDVKLIGKLMQHLMKSLQNQDKEQDVDSIVDKQLKDLVRQMIKVSKYQRITVARAISILQEILCV